MIQLFSGGSADQVWLQIAAMFRAGQAAAPQLSRAGPTTEILHAALSLSDPRQRWVVSRNPPMNLAFAIAEVVWIVTGRKDGRFLTFFNETYPKYAGQGPVYDSGYGWRLRHHLGIDQLVRGYNALRSNPASRQVVLQIWDANTDMPMEDGQPTSPDVPCNIVSLLKVRNGALEWTQVIRSNDMFKGLPYNFVQFTTLQEIMAGWLGLRVGSYNQISDSLHLYDEDFQSVVAETPDLPAINNDDLAIPKDESDSAFTELACRVERLIQPGLSSRDVINASHWPSARQSFQNMLWLLGAEAARRHGCGDVIDPIVNQCTNPAFVVLWERWFARVGNIKHR